MRLYKLLEKVNEGYPVNIYCNGDYLGQYWSKNRVDAVNEDLIKRLGDCKVESISNMVLCNGKPCIQVFLEDDE